jgi:membrane glycosyltransferase
VTGLLEILTLLLLAVGLLLLPRLFPGRRGTVKSSRPRTLSGGIRLGILASVLVPGIAALLLRPWEGAIILFVCTGVLPVFLGWGLYWVWSGFRQSGRR